jgi:hypothetical protein
MSVASALLLAWSLVPVVVIAAALALVPWLEDSDEHGDVAH